MDKVEFPCCPKCSNAESLGLLVDDDCYLEAVSMWLRYKKCVNCGWRIEIGTYRRFTKPKRHRRSRSRQEVQGRPHTGSPNQMARYDWGAELDSNPTVPA
jgi:hypothetical protein